MGTSKRKGHRKSRKIARARSSKSRTHRQRGGNLNGNPPSAWGWGMGTLGNGWQQFMNSMTLQPGENLGTIQSNASVPVGNLNAQSNQGMIGTNLQGDIPRVGGKRKNKRCKKGGSIGAALNQAAVPLVLLAANMAVGKSRKNDTYRRKFRK